MKEAILWDANISIHAPREGCDAPSQNQTNQHNQFQSTHPVRDATAPFSTICATESVFQSTHPVRDATATKTVDDMAKHHFNPRTP